MSEPADCLRKGRFHMCVPLIQLEADIKKFTKIPSFCLQNPKKQMVLCKKSAKRAKRFHFHSSGNTIGFCLQNN